MDLSEKAQRNKVSEVRHPWEQARVKVVVDILLKNLAPKEVRHIVDIGCGDVYVAKTLTKYFPNAHFHCVDTAFTDNQVDVFKQDIGELPISLYKHYQEVELGGAKADLVLLMDVIEHIEDDIVFMERLKKANYIDQSTFFMITVPAFQSLFCAHDEFLGHYRRYTNSMLEKHLDLAGYRKKELGYFFSLLLLPRYAEVKKEQLRGKKDFSTGLVNWDKGAVLTNLLTSVLYFDYKIFSRIFKLPGLSNYMICKIKS
jgi:hypothetical protein